jgi:hypothetical protein
VRLETKVGTLDRCDVCGNKEHRKRLVKTQVRYLQPDGSNYLPYSSYNSSLWTCDAINRSTVTTGVHADVSRVGVDADNDPTYVSGTQTWEGSGTYRQQTTAVDVSGLTNFTVSAAMGQALRYDSAADVTSSAPADQASFVCPANCDVTTRFSYETGKYVSTFIRYTDSNNSVRVEARVDGNLRLRKDVDGVNTNVETDTGIFTDGETYDVRIIANGSSIEVYVDGTLQIDQTVTEHTGVAGGLIRHSLATNDIRIVAGPYEHGASASDLTVAMGLCDSAGANKALQSTWTGINAMRRLWYTMAVADVASPLVSTGIYVYFTVTITGTDYWFIDDISIEGDVTKPTQFLTTSGTAITSQLATPTMAVRKVCKRCRERLLRTSEQYGRSEAPWIEPPINVDIQEV